MKARDANASKNILQGESSQKYKNTMSTQHVAEEDKYAKTQRQNMCVAEEDKYAKTRRQKLCVAEELANQPLHLKSSPRLATRLSPVSRF